MMDRILYLLQQDFGFLFAPSRHPFHRHLLLRLALYASLLVFAIRLIWPGQIPLAQKTTEANSVVPVHKSSENKKAEASIPAALSDKEQEPLLDLPAEEPDTESPRDTKTNMPALQEKPKSTPEGKTNPGT